MERPKLGSDLARHAVDLLKWFRRRRTIELNFKGRCAAASIKERLLRVADGQRTIPAFSAVHIVDFKCSACERPELPSTVAILARGERPLRKGLNNRGLASYGVRRQSTPLWSVWRV